MKIDRADAALALAEIERSQNRSASLYAYARLAPFLMATGLLWLAADLTLRFSPLLRGWAWPAAGLLAIPLFVAIALRQSRRPDGPAARDPHFRRVLGSLLVGAGFLLGAFAILVPTGHQLHGFMGLVTGFAYALLGLWAGWRLLATGIAIGLLSTIGHFAFGPGDNILFMGLVGGGGMMLGAWWLGKA